MKTLNLEKLSEIEMLLLLASTNLLLAQLSSDMADNAEDKKMVSDSWFKILASQEILKKLVDELQRSDLISGSQD